MIKSAQHDKQNALCGKTRQGTYHTRHRNLPHMVRHIKKAPFALVIMRVERGGGVIHYQLRYQIPAGVSLSSEWGENVKYQLGFRGI